MRVVSQVKPDPEVMGRLDGSVAFSTTGGREKTFRFQMNGVDIFHPKDMQTSWLVYDGLNLLYEISPTSPRGDDLNPEHKMLFYLIDTGIQKVLDAWINLLEIMRFTGPFATSEGMSAEQASWLALGLIVSRDEFEVNMERLAVHCDLQKFLDLLR